MTPALTIAIKRRQDYVPGSRAGQDVSGQVARSSLWSGLGIAATTLLQFVRSMIFARLLMPADFGIVNIANVFTQFVLIFANFGFSSSLVYHEELDKRDLATSWWGNLVVDSTAALVCVAIALVSSRFSKSPTTANVVCILAVQFVLTSLGTVNQALMRRRFMFRQLAIVSFMGALTGFLFAFCFVKFLHLGVYGLVLGTLVSAGTMSLLQFLFMPWLPSFSFSLASLRKHFAYGRWLLGVNLVTYANGNVDRVAIGGLLSSTQLGFYEYAGNLPLMMANKISLMLNSVLFPAFSSLQNRPQELRRLLRQLYRYSSLVIFPMLTGMALVGPEFVRIAYGEKWMPIVTALRLFCLFGALRLYIQPLNTLCNGVGEQQLPFRWALVYLPINLACIYAGVTLGQLEGVVLARSVMPVFIASTLGVQIMRRIDVPWSLLLKSTLPAATACAAMAACVLGIDQTPIVQGLHPLVHLAVQVIAGVLCYIVTLLLAWRSDLMDLAKLLRRFRD